MSSSNVAVVHELLHAGNHSSELLAGNHLQRLHVDLAILGSTNGMQQVAGLIIVAFHNVVVVINVLTNAGTVDADVA